MTRSACASLSLCALVIVTGCAFTTNQGRGDENGTPVWLNPSATGEDALNTAQEHCARFGRAAAEKSREGNRIDFACVEPASLRRIVQAKAMDGATLAELRSAPQIQLVHYAFPLLRQDPPRQRRALVDWGMRNMGSGHDDDWVGVLLGTVFDLVAMRNQVAEISRFSEELAASERRGARLVRDYSLADPILTVKSQLLLALREAGLRDVRDVPEPVSGQSVDSPPTGNPPEGLVIELGTRDCTLRTSARTLDFMAYGQLRRAGESTPLWEAECRFPQQILPGAEESQSEGSVPGAALRLGLAEVAVACAAGLAGSLLQGGNSQ